MVEPVRQLRCAFTKVRDPRLRQRVLQLRAIRRDGRPCRQSEQETLRGAAARLQ
jgi:hypothetical protein